MPTVAFVERKIAVIEGFAVKIRYAGPGRAKCRNVRGDRADLPTYGFRRAAAGSLTVAAWISKRFAHAFPGYAVEVLNGDETVASGRSLLSTVRATYR